MSIGGTPIDTSLLQTAQAQQTASKARDRERVLNEQTQRYLDQVELRVAGMESSEAVRRLPPNDSEQADAEHEAEGRQLGSEPEGEDRPRIDVTA